MKITFYSIAYLFFVVGCVIGVLILELYLKQKEIKEIAQKLSIVSIAEDNNANLVLSFPKNKTIFTEDKNSVYIKIGIASCRERVCQSV